MIDEHTVHLRDRARHGIATCGTPAKLERLQDWGEDINCPLCQAICAAEVTAAAAGRRAATA